MNLAGCSKLAGFMMDQRKHAKQIEKEVIDLIEDEDADELCDLFAESYRNNCMSEQLEVLCHYWNELDPEEGKFKYTEMSAGTTDGEYDYLELRHTLETKTRSGVELELVFDEYWINNDEDCVGLIDLCIEYDDAIIYWIETEEEIDMSDRDVSLMCDAIDDIVDLINDDDFVDADDEEKTEMGNKLLDEHVSSGAVVPESIECKEMSMNYMGYVVSFKFVDGKESYIIIDNGKPDK